MRITLHVCTRNRPTELALLLQSLRTQTFKNWDLVIIDESDYNLTDNHFLNCMLMRVYNEGHYVNICKNNLRLGVCNARNLAIEKDYFNNEFICRVDDDVVLESNYLEKLLKVIKKGYDIASGVTPSMFNPIVERDVKHVKPIINRKLLDHEFNIVKYGDDCGVGYLSEDVISADEFRSCALMKKEVVQQVKYENNLSPVGFREEAFFSFRARQKGFKIGVNTKAIAWHIQCPSGGCRYPDYMQKVQSDDNYFRKWIKDFMSKKWKC